MTSIQDRFLAALARLPGLSGRLATAEDRALLRALVAADVEDMLAQAPAGARSVMLSLQLDGRRMAQASHHPRAQEVVLVRDGDPVGMLLADWSHPTRVYLLDALLLPARRGQGVGGAVLAALQAAAGEAGRNVQATLFYASPARALFRRAGFRETGRDGLDLLLDWEA